MQVLVLLENEARCSYGREPIRVLCRQRAEGADRTVVGQGLNQRMETNQPRYAASHYQVRGTAGIHCPSDGFYALANHEAQDGINLPLFQSLTGSPPNCESIVRSLGHVECYARDENSIN